MSEINVESIKNLNYETLQVKKWEDLSYAIIRKISHLDNSADKEMVEEKFRSLSNDAKRELNDLLKNVKTEKLNTGSIGSNDAMFTNPKTAIDYKYVAQTYYLLHKYPDAIIAFKKAIELDPINKNSYQESIDNLQKEIQKNTPLTKFDYNSMGWEYNRLWDYKEALTAFKKAIELDPNYWSEYFRSQVEKAFKEHKENSMLPVLQFLKN